MAARRNGFGVTGIAHAATVSAFSHNTVGSAGAIQRAADLLGPGDILVLEMHRPGPRYNFRYRNDQLGYIAVEWWPDDFAAIRYAVGRGVTVIEAAGNGAQDFDAPLYDTPGTGFPDDWINPFNGPDSGAVLVGAGAPAGDAYGPARSRLSFSNFGSRLDCQGWGEGVCAPGYNDLYRGRGEHEWYTAQFNGTSSASPVVAGVAACLLGISRKRGALVTPYQLRDLFRDNGSPQTGDLRERIGSLPDLADLISKL
jgi:subtilisin family serine protease